MSDTLSFPECEMQFAEHDHVIWFGDLNYRIDLPNERVRTATCDTYLPVHWQLYSLIQAADWDALYAEDQLNKTREAKTAFHQFTEAPLLFAPTYKYDHGTTIYDTSKKKRQPAWCDRVLWRKSSKIRPRA